MLSGLKSTQMITLGEGIQIVFDPSFFEQPDCSVPCSKKTRFAFSSRSSSTSSHPLIGWSNPLETVLARPYESRARQQPSHSNCPTPPHIVRGNHAEVEYWDALLLGILNDDPAHIHDADLDQLVQIIRAQILQRCRRIQLGQGTAP